MTTGRFYITTPIYYVNDVPHIGHAYTTVAADVAARWRRMSGERVRFLTGTDEHGQKVLRAAEKRGVSPQAHVDELQLNFKRLWERLDIQYDDFIRTTEPRHAAVVRELLQKLWDQGEIYAADYSGWYSVSAERFWSEEEVLPAGATLEDLRAGKVKGVCPDSGREVEWITERNYFFKMSAYQERLIAWIEGHPDCIRPHLRRNEVLGFLKKPLGDLCISRPKARLPWGIPLPFAEDYVTYVWFDALTNYVSSLGDERDAWWPADFHVVGKDILTFHTVYWFSMLLAVGLEPPRSVFAHGWWTNRKAKISKSAGNAVDPNPLIDRYGADALRYFLLKEIPFGGDGDFSHEALLGRYNADLANDLGNLAHRALSMTEKWFAGVLPAAGEALPQDLVFQQLGVDACAKFDAQIRELGFRDALEDLFQFIRAGNKYIDTEAPWALAKRGDTARLGQVLRCALECVRIAASHLSCVCPSKSAALLAKLGLDAPNLSLSFTTLAAGSRVAAGDPLFPRLEAEAPPQEPVVSEPVTPEIPSIEYDDFAKVALRTGLVVSAEKHPKADKLLVLKVDVGEAAPRQICAGIAPYYTPEELVGKTVIVVANLKPRMLRGLESNGMILAAGDAASLLSPLREVAPGTQVR